MEPDINLGGQMMVNIYSFGNIPRFGKKHIIYSQILTTPSLERFVNKVVYKVVRHE